MAWMAGQLFVTDVELPDVLANGRVQLSRGLRHTVRLAESEVWSGQSFLGMRFEDAVELFLERSIIPPEQYYAGLGDIRSRSFTASRLAAGRVRQTAYNALVDALESGQGFDEFARLVSEAQIDLGIAPQSHGYLRTVFDTNVVSAYAAGRDVQLTNPAVIDEIPWRVYVAVDDARVRPEHLALDGKSWDARITDEWRAYQGPNGFNCRCMTVSSGEPEKLADGSERHPDQRFNAAPSLAV